MAAGIIFFAVGLAAFAFGFIPPAWAAIIAAAGIFLFVYSLLRRLWQLFRRFCCWFFGLFGGGGDDSATAPPDDSSADDIDSDGSAVTAGRRAAADILDDTPATEEEEDTAFPVAILDAIAKEEKRLEKLYERFDRARAIYGTTAAAWERWQHSTAGRGLLYDIQTAENKIAYLKRAAI